jgi:hypothetical protein
VEFASGGADEPADDDEDAQSQPFGFVAGGGAGQSQTLDPGKQVGG